MAFKSSLVDKLSNAISPKIRALRDVNVKLLGTRTNIIRIKEEEINILGDKTFSYQVDLVDNVIIQYPFNQVEIFGSKDSSNSSTNTIEFFDLLPINLYHYFDKDYTTKAVDIDENDIVVDVLWDNKGTGIPIIMQASRTYGSFNNKNMIGRKIELTLRRGPIEDPIQDIIDQYIEAQIHTSGVIN
jgi:hypothetical protein